MYDARGREIAGVAVECVRMPHKVVDCNAGAKLSRCVVYWCVVVVVVEGKLDVQGWGGA